MYATCSGSRPAGKKIHALVVYIWISGIQHKNTSQPVGNGSQVHMHDNILTCLIKVLEAHFIDRKEAHRGTILRTHVGDGCSVSNGELCHSGSKELHKFTNYTYLTQILCVCACVCVFHQPHKDSCICICMHDKH